MTAMLATGALAVPGGASDHNQDCIPFDEWLFSGPDTWLMLSDLCEGGELGPILWPMLENRLDPRISTTGATASIDGFAPLGDVAQFGPTVFFGPVTIQVLDETVPTFGAGPEGPCDPWPVVFHCQADGPAAPLRAAKPENLNLVCLVERHVLVDTDGDGPSEPLTIPLAASRPELNPCSRSG